MSEQLGVSPASSPRSTALASRPEANARCGLPPLLLRLTCLAPSVDIRRRSLVSVAIVTQLVTHPQGCQSPRGRSSGGHGPHTTRHRIGVPMRDVERRLVERRASQLVNSGWKGRASSARGTSSATFRPAFSHLNTSHRILRFPQRCALIVPLARPLVLQLGGETDLSVSDRVAPSLLVLSAPDVGATRSSVHVRSTTERVESSALRRRDLQRRCAGSGVSTPDKDGIGTRGRAVTII